MQNLYHSQTETDVRPNGVEKLKWMQQYEFPYWLRIGPITWSFASEHYRLIPAGTKMFEAYEE